MHQTEDSIGMLVRDVITEEKLCNCPFKASGQNLLPHQGLAPTNMQTTLSQCIINGIMLVKLYQILLNMAGLCN